MNSERKEKGRCNAHHPRLQVQNIRGDRSY